MIQEIGNIKILKAVLKISLAKNSNVVLRALVTLQTMRSVVDFYLLQIKSLIE